jgi:membrane associated rhomboid family serine protease
MPTCYRHPNRETGLSCSECGRPICTDCMTVAAVGIRCPDHSGRTRNVRTPRAARSLPSPSGAFVTGALIAINVGVYLVELLNHPGGLYGTGSYFFREGALAGPLVAQGDWWRLFTAMFLHYGPIHLGLNMLALYWFGNVVESAIGHLRFLALYLVSGLAGSAGALLLSPNALTVGASGAIFGVLGALLILEWMATGSFAGQAMSMIVLNLALTGVFHSSISVGGHVGGLVAGVVGMFALARLRHYRRQYLGIAAVLLIGAASVAIAYWTVA